MLKCEGYKMFRGKATIIPTNKAFGPFEVYGTWLYKPEYDCWYVKGDSYPASIVHDILEDENA